jgi:hypothetical protein
MSQRYLSRSQKDIKSHATHNRSRSSVHFEVYPSHHLDAMRGLKDVASIYLDEADYFPPSRI